MQRHLHSNGDPSRPAALLLLAFPDIRGRHALPAERLAVLGATMSLHHGLLDRGLVCARGLQCWLIVVNEDTNKSLSRLFVPSRLRGCPLIIRPWFEPRMRSPSRALPDRQPSGAAASRS